MAERTRLSVGVIVFVTALLALPGSAMAVRITFTGEVVYVGPFIAGGQIALGAPISGSLNYDRAAQDLVPDDPTFAIYPVSGPFSFSFGPYAGTASVGGFYISDGFDAGADYLSVFSNAVVGGTNLGRRLSGFRLQLYDPSGLALSSDSLPLSSPSLADYTLSDINTSHLILTFSSGSTFATPYQARGRILSIQIVPEPAASTLIVSSVVYALLRAGRRFAWPIDP